MERIPAEASGGGAIARRMMERVGLAVLGRIKAAFVTKARGGADDAGDRWSPLSPKTVAYSRRGRTRAERRRPATPSQALNARQQDRWWEVYRRTLAWSKSKATAARVAWATVKREGATTLFQKYSGRSAEILRDTGLLLNTLTPGYGGGEQVFEVAHGRVTIGTKRKGASAHHHGTKRLPQRRLWPDPSKWPVSWWKDMLTQLKQGLLEVAANGIK